MVMTVPKVNASECNILATSDCLEGILNWLDCTESQNIITEGFYDKVGLFLNIKKTHF